MGVIEPEQLPTQLARALLALQIVAIAHAETTARSFVSDVWQGQRVRHDTVAPDQGATAFVRIGFDAVRANRLGHSGLK